MPVKVTLLQPGILGLPGTTVYMTGAGKRPDVLTGRGGKTSLSAKGARANTLTVSALVPSRVREGG